MPKKAQFTNFPNADRSKQNCALCISLGQKYHSSENLEAVTRTIAGHRFGRRYVMLADTLQAHNAMLDDSTLTIKDARKQKEQEGNIFLETNKQLLENYDVVRWEDFLKDQDYTTHKNTIDSLYINDKDFKKVVDSTAGKFLGMRMKQLQQQKDFDLENAQNLCREYIKEELAVMLLWHAKPDEYPYHFLVYPKKMHEAAKFIHDKYVKRNQANVLQELLYQITTPSKKATHKDNKGTEIPSAHNGFSFFKQFHTFIPVSAPISLHQEQTFATPQDSTFPSQQLISQIPVSVIEKYLQQQTSFIFTAASSIQDIKGRLHFLTATFTSLSVFMQIIHSTKNTVPFDSLTPKETIETCNNSVGDNRTTFSLSTS